MILISGLAIQVLTILNIMGVRWVHKFIDWCAELLVSAIDAIHDKWVASHLTKGHYWKEILAKPNYQYGYLEDYARAVICRMQGHPYSISAFTSNSPENGDFTCMNCGDDLG